MKVLAYSIRFLTPLVVFCALASAVPAGQYIELGTPDGLIIDQPMVSVVIQSTDGGGLYWPNGPSLQNGDDVWLLDTGAQTLLAAMEATGEMVAEGFQTQVAIFDETGVGGTTPYFVTAPYLVEVTSFSSNYSMKSMPGSKLLTSETVSFKQPFFGGPGGVIGMPAMLNHVITLDNTNMITDDISTGINFGDSIPTSNGHRYSVPLQLRHFGHSDQPNPGDDLPTYAPIPFLNVDVESLGATTTGSLVLDTGAQKSILSESMGYALGLDRDGDGSFLDDADDSMSILGAGGTVVTVPIFYLDRLSVPTAEGVDIVWTNVPVGILTIDPSIDGIFGYELLNSAWDGPVMEYIDYLFFGGTLSGDHGHIDYVHFDFTDSDNLNGTMLLDLNPAYDNVMGVPDFLPGDANGDGVVSAGDYASVQMNFGNVGTPGLPGDANGDGMVSAGDYASVQANFGNAAGAQVTPEPGTLSLLVLGGGVVMLRHKRK